MWLRVLLFVCVTSSVVNSNGIYRAVHPRLIPWWFAKFPNSRVLLNRDYFNHIYRNLILRDPYWYRRLHTHRHRIIHPFPIAPAFLGARSVRVQAPSLLSQRVIRKSPAPAIVKTASVTPHKHLIGKAETFVRYSSPSIAKYNTPWIKRSSTYKDYGHVSSPPIYDRQVVGGVAGLYDEEVSLPVFSSGAGNLDSSYVAPIPDYSPQTPLPPQPAVPSSTTVGSDKHLIGKSETFVRYYSPTIDRYNTPWKKVASSYRDYGHVYDRQVVGAGPGNYDDGLPLTSLPSGAGSLDSSLGVPYNPYTDGGFVAGSGSLDGGFAAGGGSVDGGFVAGGGSVNGGFVAGGGSLDGGFVAGGGSVNGGFVAGGGSVDGGFVTGDGSVDGTFSDGFSTGTEFFAGSQASSGEGLGTYGSFYRPEAQTTLRQDVF